MSSIEQGATDLEDRGVVQTYLVQKFVRQRRTNTLTNEQK